MQNISIQHADETTAAKLVPVLTTQQENRHLSINITGNIKIVYTLAYTTNPSGKKSLTGTYPSTERSSAV